MTPRQNSINIYWHESVDSTNSVVRRQIDELDNLSITAAVTQTAGRGRGGHKWAAKPGANLTFSILLKFGDGTLEPLLVRDSLLITHAATIALKHYFSEKGISPRIKWPNDIWVADRKICGILIENILDADKVAASIVGIGINLNQRDFDPALPNPTSLSLETGKDYRIKEELEAFASCFMDCCVKMNSLEGRNELAAEFADSMFYLEKDRQDALDAAIAHYESMR